MTDHAKVEFTRRIHVRRWPRRLAASATPPGASARDGREIAPHPPIARRGALVPEGRKTAKSGTNVELGSLAGMGRNVGRRLFALPGIRPCALCGRFRGCPLRRFVELCGSCGRYSHYTAQDLGLKGIKNMKRMLFALLAATALGASSGCCCLENWWCRPWGCCGGCNDGCGGGCGDSCGGGCSSCGGQYGQQGNPQQGYAQQGYAQQGCGPQGCGPRGCRRHESLRSESVPVRPESICRRRRPSERAGDVPLLHESWPARFLARNPNSIGP